MAASLAPVFHGNASLADSAPQLASLKESWARDVKAILKIILAGGKTEVIAATASSLPNNDPLRFLLTQGMVNTLWSSMLHPPLSYKGPKMQYRSADGSGNNYLFPQLGQAGLPYAKTVQASGAMTGAKPDPGDLFDMLMARDESPNTINKDSDLGISSQLLYHADLIIHDIFRTNSKDRNISDTSSYLDLSPLYGRDREHQEAVRTMWKNGKLKPDSWAEDRLRSQPPGVQIYIIMYNRFHNYVAEQLKEINENQKFSPLPFSNTWTITDDFASRVFSPPVLNHLQSLKKQISSKEDIETVYKEMNMSGGYLNLLAPFYKARLEEDMVSTQAMDIMQVMWELHQGIKIDEDLFQTARLVTCGLYITISINDYLRCLMRKHAEPTSWTLDPRKELSLFGKKESMQRGIGNQVTTEFNALYRFHSPISKRDAAWTKWFIQKLLVLSGIYIDPDDKTKKTDPTDKTKNLVTKAQFEQGDLPLHVLPLVLALVSSSGDNSRRRDALATPYDIPKHEKNSSESESSKKKKSDDEIAEEERKKNLDDFLNQIWVLEDAGMDEHDEIKIKPMPLKRNPRTLKYDDAELLAEMARVMSDPICEFGAQNVPKFMRSIEIMGILQSRKWEMASLNEFRVFFGMPRHKSFADMNSDPQIQDKLEALYGHPDMVEFYPGVFLEGQGRCLDPGTSCGNGSSTALWRAVFSDAVTLVRSDRFYTIDWNNDSMTSWGLAEVSPDLDVFKGGVFARLYQRAFPGFFKSNAIPLWQPLYTPAMNAMLAYEQGMLNELESVESLGVPQEYFKKVMQFRNDPRLLRKDTAINALLEKSGLRLGNGDLKEANQIKEQLNAAHDKLGFMARIFHGRHDDAEKLSRKVCFKLLHRKMKIKVAKQQVAYKPISDMTSLREYFLNPAKVAMFKNPGFADVEAVPSGPLRSVLSQQGDLYLNGLAICQHAVTKEMERDILTYFVDMSNAIRQRQELNYSYYKDGTVTPAKQLDVIHDFAIPVVTRFAADLLGVGDQVKTELAPKRPWGESDLYQHFQNCQDYLTFDSDETRAFRRRKAFQKSVTILYKLAQEGVKKAQFGWLEFRRRNYPDIAEKDPKARESVARVRAFGAHVARALTKGLGSQEDAAAVLLAAAMDAIHKSVLMFAEVLDLLHKPVSSDSDKASRVYWKEIQKLSRKNNAEADKVIGKYVLEAQRIALTTPLVRKYVPSAAPQRKQGSDTTVDNDQFLRTFQDGDMFFLEVHKALNDPEVWERPEEIDLNRPLSDREHYLVYQRPADGAFNAKQLTIHAVSGMIKHLATLARLREAHEDMGRLKRVKVPRRGDPCADAYRDRFLTQKWDQTSNTPSTWSLRYDGVYNGVGEGVAGPEDNSLQHHDLTKLPGQTDDLS